MAGRLATLQRRVSVLDTRTARDPVAGSFADPERGSTTARGYGWDWQQRRLRILQRDKYQCQLCKPKGWLTAARHVDHIVAKADGGSDDDSNLQSLCKPCHDAKTEAENAARRAPGFGAHQGRGG